MTHSLSGAAPQPASGSATAHADAPDTLRDLCREYADRLYDYCRSLLADDEALSATVGTFHGATAHARRLSDSRLQRAWVYALARAECQARLAGTTGTGGNIGPANDGPAELANEVLACLDPREREILDLTLRHDLTLDEVARILDIATDAVAAAALQGRRNAERWLAAVMDARRPNPRCTLLADLVAAWMTSPTRLIRAHISRHVRACPNCQAAPAKATITTLLTRLPILASPLPPDRILTAPKSSTATAETGGEGWHPDGFPVQPDALENPPPPGQPLTMDEGFTPERPTRGPSPADFWEPDLDAADPESRIRWGRLSLITVAALAATAATWSLVFAPDTGRPARVTAADDDTLVVTPGDRLPPVVDSPPPPPPPVTTGTDVSHPTTTPSLTPLAASRPTTRRPPPPPSAHPTKPSSTPRRSSPPPLGTGPDTPPPPRSSTPPKTSATPTPQPQISTPPPPPPPPSLSASTSSVDLGTSRQGRVTLASRTGAITWRAGGSNLATTPGSGSIGDGDSITVDFSLQVGLGTTSDCGKTLSTYLSISWSGDNKGTKGSGTVGVTVTYTKTCPQPL
ncbi:sigma-70 family RNA polymerase sigma factor [Sphaerisporangium sp. NPDC005289]|uniref:RNA polymerase sigma factor n=1 Tax=Sphaerisporangium sp. NPDC005289 TaxID=3155247 RepID=UPI00339F7433